MSKLVAATLLSLLALPASPSLGADLTKAEAAKPAVAAPHAPASPAKAESKPAPASPAKAEAKPAAQAAAQKLPKLRPVDKPFYEKAAAEKGMVKTRSGVLYKSLKEGTGASPGILSTVTVRYRGTLANGKEFNSTYARKSPESHRMNRVFVCWQEGLRMMKPGGKARLVCPSATAFADRGVYLQVPKNALVNYEIELLNVK